MNRTIKQLISISLLSSIIFCESKIDKKINTLLKQMTVEEKIGQMTQIDRRFLRSDEDLIKFGIGSILSGGGSVPEDNTVEGWANMYNHFQKTALKSRLKIPII